MQLLSENRLAVYVVTGSSRFELRSLGDFLEHDERYARTAEFLQVFQAVWAGAAHGNTYLMWGEPPAMIAERIHRMHDLAAPTDEAA